MSGMLDRKTLRIIAVSAAMAGSAGFMAGRSCAPLEERHARASAEACAGMDTGSGATELMRLITKRSVRQTAAQLRSELGAGAEGQARLEFVFAVGPDGSLSLSGSNASCRSLPCPMESELPAIIGTLIASEWAVQSGDGACVIRIEVDIPPVADGMPQRLFRLQPGRGIDL